MPKENWAIAPSDLSIVEGIFESNSLTGTPMFCWSEVGDRWEVYESTNPGALVAYLCKQSRSWTEPA